MQLRHDDFGSRHTFGRVDFGRNTAAIVGHGAGSVGVQRHRHERCVAGQRLVDCVVDDLIDHVMEARAVIGIADIHAGPLADGIQPFENLDGIGVVVGLDAVRKSRRIVHEILSVRSTACRTRNGHESRAGICLRYRRSGPFFQGLQGILAGEEASAERLWLTVRRASPASCAARRPYSRTWPANARFLAGPT